MAKHEGTHIIGCKWPEHPDKTIEYEVRLQYAARLLLGSNTSVGHIWTPAKPEAVADLQEHNPDSYARLIERASDNLARLGITQPNVGEAEMVHVTQQLAPVRDEATRQSVAA